MAVGGGAAVTRNVLDDALHAARLQPVQRRAAEGGDHVRVAGEGALADNLVRAGLEQVQNRGAVGVNADLQKVMGDQAVLEAASLQRGVAIHVVEFAERRGGRVFAPVRRAQPGDRAAFLIDEDWRVAANGVAQIGAERGDLLPVLAIALEQDEAPRVGVGEEGALLPAQAQPFTAIDRGELAHRATEMQS